MNLPQSETELSLGTKPLATRIRELERHSLEVDSNLRYLQSRIVALEAEIRRLRSGSAQ